MTPEDLQFASIFRPHYITWAEKIVKSDAKFAHYTSAQTLLSIVEYNRVWMRNARLMNDFRELEYGLDHLIWANRTGRFERLKSEINLLFPDLFDEMVELTDAWLEDTQSKCWITSMSAHAGADLVHGRLSMWRAYARDSGVAILVNHQPFLGASDAFEAYTHPVVYLNQSGFEAQIDKLAESIANNREFLLRMGRDRAGGHLWGFFEQAMVCMKHPGFQEETEWRVVYFPSRSNKKVIEKDRVAILGVPQTIYKIPLKDRPQDDLEGIEFDQFLYRIIVGPSEHGSYVRNEIIEMLTDAGVSNARDRVFASDIPLRS